MTHKKSCIILFTKYPEKGSVKTRIAKHMGRDFAFELYSRLLRDSIDQALKVGVPVIVSLWPETRINDFKRWCGGERRFVYSGQRGRDLGEKMSNAFIDAFASGFDDCILIGCDLPGLPAIILTEALSRLAESDAVIGPAADGGYYLIGFSKQSFLPAAFKSISWSTASVFNDTITSFRRFGLKHDVLGKRRDLDTIEDLAGIILRKDTAPDQSSSARDFILDHGQAIIEALKRSEKR